MGYYWCWTVECMIDYLSNSVHVLNRESKHRTTPLTIKG